MKQFKFWLLVAGLIHCSMGDSCSKRYYNKTKTIGPLSFVCVCNSASCDQLGKVVYPSKKGSYIVYESNSESHRFNRRSGFFVKNSTKKADVTVKLDPNLKFQSILGFGGAFTDSAAINYEGFKDSRLKANLIKSYYSEDGLEYNMGRIPMASCDFSTHEYSYANVEGDFNLTHFKLASEDIDAKIPMIEAAKKTSAEEILFFGSPWSAPAWMKTNGRMAAGGSLKGKPGGKYYKTWARYFIKFIEEYQRHNISMWGLTSQNEPTNLPETTKFQQMHFSATEMRDFVKTDLGPALFSSGFEAVKLMVIDDQRLFIPYWTSTILADQDAKKYVSGIAVHWYFDSFVTSDVLSKAHEQYPDIFILPTEACQGSQPWDLQKVSLGSWHRAQTYAADIIDDLNNYAVGWIDWNLDLNTEGGPNWVKNFVDSPIMVNTTKENEEYLKQPMYYALGHFSKFLKRNSVRIGTQITGAADGIEGVAFQDPKGFKILVLLNKNDKSVSLEVHLKDNGSKITDVMSPNSIQTYIWK